MVCLDTSFIIALIRRHEAAEEKLEEYTSAGERLTTTPIAACELFKGAYRSNRREDELGKVRGMLGFLELLEFSAEACERYGKLMSDVSLRSRQLGDMDAIIASIALTSNEKLVTANMKHFERVPGLLLDSW